VHGVSSAGTDTFRIEFERLERACVDGVGKIADIELRQSFEILFGRLRAIDACCDDIIFFDDEGGSWQLGVDWLKIAPPTLGYSPRPLRRAKPHRSSTP
jgi:hypothetical protein